MKWCVGICFIIGLMFSCEQARSAEHHLFRYKANGVIFEKRTQKDDFIEFVSKLSFDTTKTIFENNIGISFGDDIRFLNLDTNEYTSRFEVYPDTYPSDLVNYLNSIDGLSSSIDDDGYIKIIKSNEYLYRINGYMESFLDFVEDPAGDMQ